MLFHSARHKSGTVFSSPFTIWSNLKNMNLDASSSEADAAWVLHTVGGVSDLMEL